MRSHGDSILTHLNRSKANTINVRSAYLIIVRPQSLSLEAYAKSDSEIADEKAKHSELANQISMFDATAKPLTPCSMRFVAKWQDQDGKNRTQECDDWETSAAFNRFERLYGRAAAITALKKKYEEEYMEAGLVLAFSTHKRRNAEFGTHNQWLLVGMIRLDETRQTSLAF